MNPTVPTENESAILILEDGRILARNVTLPIAKLLLSLNPGDAELARRTGSEIETRQEEIKS